MPFRITQEQVGALDYDLDSAIAEYTAAREAHKKTVDVPAPTAEPLVEAIVKKFGGLYEIVESVWYARVIDNKILDMRKLPNRPADPEWVKATADMRPGYVWDAELEKWRKADEGKGATAVQLAQAEEVLASVDGRLMKGETAIKFQRQMIEALQAENEEIRQRLNEINGRLDALTPP